MAKQRSIFWDNYKGILIFLVVFGHCIFSYANNMPNAFVENLYLFIYSFHMPAFIFCSGYFSKSERSRSKESLIKLLLYYVVFNFLMAAIAYLYLGTDIKVLTPYYSYWYILSLATWRLCIGGLSRIKGLVVISLVVALLAGYCDELTNVLSLRRTVVFFVFFAAGYLFDRSKVEEFLARRQDWKIWQNALCVVVVVLAAIAAYEAIVLFDVTGTMTLMSSYGDWSDIFFRALLFVIAIAAIAGMFLVVPNREIPFLSKIGRNSLLIYLGHRIFTIVFYEEFCPWQTYEHSYLILAFLVSVAICFVLGSNRLNKAVADPFNRAASAIVNRENASMIGGDAEMMSATR